MTVDINLSNFQNLPTIMKPSLVPRVPWDQGFCDPDAVWREIDKEKATLLEGKRKVENIKIEPGRERK